MKNSPQHKTIYYVAITSIIVPLVVMIWDIRIGAILFVLGAMSAYRAIRFGMQGSRDSLSDSEKQKLERHQSNMGRTILVQIVDDFGRDLPPSTVQKLMAEAQAKASPRDTVVGVRHKISSDEERTL
jgi:hypothetical protein